MITIHRGTNKEVVISLCDDSGKDYKLSETEHLVFGVKDNVYNDKYLLSKVIKSNQFVEAQKGYLLEITPEDTKNLSFGQYVYDVGLQKENGEFHIVVPCSTFTVAETVTERVV